MEQFTQFHEEMAGVKKYRPYRSGFIVLYSLAALSVADAVYTIVGKIRGELNPVLSSFSVFSYLVAALGITYSVTYLRTVVCIDDARMRIVFPAFLPLPAGEKPTVVQMLFKSGSNYLRVIDKTIELKTIERYGYVEDLGFSNVDKTGAKPTTPLFPVHEVCFLTSDGKRYHMNAGNYGKKQLKEMFSQIRDATGIMPEGSLRQVFD